MKKKEARSQEDVKGATVSHLMTVEQAMEVLHIGSRNTMYDLINKFGLPVVRVGANNLRIRPEALAAWILENEQKAV